MSTMFWIWMAAAVLFLIGEIVISTFFLLCFAVAAAGAGIYAIWGPEEYYWQIGIFIFSSVVLIPFTRSLAGRVSGKPAQVANIDNLIDARAVVTKEIDPLEGGQVRIEGETWLATASARILAGTAVRVTRVSGAKVHVEIAE